MSSAEILLYSIEYFGDWLTRKWILKDESSYLKTPYFVPPHPGLIIGNDLIKSLGLRFDLSYIVCSDIKFMLESLRYSSNVLISGFILSKMPSGGVSSKFLFRRVNEFYLIYRGLGYTKSVAFGLIFKRSTSNFIQFIQ